MKQSNELGRNFAVTPRMTAMAAGPLSLLLPLAFSLSFSQSGILMWSRCSASPGWESRRTRRVHRPWSCRTGGSPQIETSFSPIARGPLLLASLLIPLLFLFFPVDSATARKCYKVVLRAEIAHVTEMLLPRICISAEAPERWPRLRASNGPLSFFVSIFTALRTICSAFFFFFPRSCCSTTPFSRNETFARFYGAPP